MYVKELAIYCFACMNHRPLLGMLPCFWCVGSALLRCGVTHGGLVMGSSEVRGLHLSCVGVLSCAGGGLLGVPQCACIPHGSVSIQCAAALRAERLSGGGPDSRRALHHDCTHNYRCAQQVITVIHWQAGTGSCACSVIRTVMNAKG